MKIFNTLFHFFITFIYINLLCILILYSSVYSSQDKKVFEKVNLLIQNAKYLNAVQTLDNISKSFSKNSENYLISQILKANALKAMGRHKLALSTLLPFVSDISEYSQPQLIVKFYISLGNIYLAFSNQETASKYFEKSLKLAKQTENYLLASEVLNEMGMLFYIYAEHQDFGIKSIKAFELALDYLEKSSSYSHETNLFHGTIMINMTRAFLYPKNNLKTTKKNDQINKTLNFVTDLPDTYRKCMQMITIAHFFEQMILSDKKKYSSYIEKAYTIYKTVENINQSIKNDRLASIVYCRMGALYERTNQLESAISLTRRAIFSAQSISAPENTYIAHWQLGRLYRKKGQEKLAINQYQKSIEVLTPIRQQIYHSDLMKKKIFDKKIKPVYLELAEVFFYMASKQSQPDQYENMVRNVWTTMDKVKTAELEDIFNDECVSYKEKDYLSLDNHLDSAAVMYVIPFEKQPGIIVKLPDGFRHYSLQVDTKTFNKTIFQFRQALQKWDDINTFAMDLYNWIISPIYGDLKKQEVKTLVVASDGAMRLLPFSLFLKSDETFLIEEFEIVTIPSLQLTRTIPTNRETPNILLCGLTTKRTIGNKIFPALPLVNKELAEIQKILPGEVLINSNFSHSNLTRILAQNEISIIHMATHGEFVGIPEKSFLLTEKGRLTMNDLEGVIKLTPSASIDLLTLSACQTAIGDERAAFGLAGVAVKAGANCAIASLWSVDDYISQKIIKEFYLNVFVHKKTKATALQLAQLKILEKPQFWYPATWAAFLVIGNWY